MKISKVEIFNWRSIVSEEIEFNDLMIFIGQNNHGKSNILSAILFFFGEISLQDIDYNQNSSEINIKITFINLNKLEKATFKKYLAIDNSIKVCKKAIKNEGFSYHGYIQQPREDWLKEENISDFKARATAIELPLAGLLPDTGTITIAKFREAQLQYIQENKTTIEFDYILETTNFLGFKNVATGSFGDLFFIPSIKRASDELSPKGNSLFAQLYSRVVNKMSETNPDFIQAKEKILALTEILNKNKEDGSVNENRPSDLTSLEVLIDDELKAWNTKIDIQITPPNVNDIFRIGANVLVDDGVKTDIERKGHGLQRALIFALIKAWASILKEDGEEGAVDREISKSTYFIFEEPELFLHPQAQKQLFSSLVELSNGEGQVFMCTHSSSFLSLAHHKSICIVKKDSVEEGSKILQCNEDIFSDINDKKKFDLVHWLNPERSELFFAKKIILTEGATEKSIIPMIAQNIGIHTYEYTIIDCGGKTNIPHYIKLFNKFKLNYVAVYDLDHQEGKTQNGIDSANLSSRLIEDEIEEELGKSIIFNNDIEEELGMTAAEKSGKPYKAVMYINDEDFILLESLKQKIELIYN